MIDVKDRRIVLIGGAGFIGHHLALRLKHQGADVRIIDGLEVNNLLMFASAGLDVPHRRLYSDMINQRLALLRQAEIPLYVQDARDYHALSHILGEIEPQVVVQLAAVAHAGRSNKDPYSTFDHSLRTLENALDCSRTIEHFLFFSSSMVYGNFGSSAVTESHALDPIGIYGALKLAGEKLVIAYNQVFGLPYTIIRPSALYGARCVSRRVGQVFIENAIAGKPLTIEGDGADQLDFTHIDDLVEGTLLAIKHPKARNQVFNLTYGQSGSILDLAEIIKSEFPGVSLEMSQRDQLSPVRGTLLVDKARELIGYEPSLPIEVGFKQYIEWYRRNVSMIDELQTDPAVGRT